MPTKPDILDLSVKELKEACASITGKPYSGIQVLQWLYQKRARDFGSMSNVSKTVRDELDKNYLIGRLDIVEQKISSDGTTKFKLGLRDGHAIEAVLIPEEAQNDDSRLTLCVSTQVGCAMGCKFCRTAQMGLIRNLSSGEILEQVLTVQDWLGPSGKDKKLNNIVFMGMGEPLHNYDNVISAIEILINDMGFNFSRRRVTLSTSGLVPELERFVKETKVQLAISLNATCDKVRGHLMPINQAYDIDHLMETCRNLPLAQRDKITFEYVLIGGVNDSVEQASELVKILKGVKAKINLIRFNPWEGCDFKSPEDEDVLAFQKYLLDRGFTVILRKSRGADILAACGQLIE